MIKKLSKAQLAEGLTLEFVNSVKMIMNYSPIQLEPGDEPLPILENSKGFWGKPVGEDFLKEKDEKTLIIFSHDDCQIGRARYLMNFGKEEREAKIQALLSSWKKAVRDKLDNIKIHAKTLHNIVEGKGFELLGAFITKYAAQENLDNLEPILVKAKKLYDSNNLEPLLRAFDIVRFDNNMFSAKYDDKVAMEKLKALFGADALKEWSEKHDCDMLYKHAQIIVEKQY